jgi:hypothetical protein
MNSAATNEDAFEPHAAGPALLLSMQLERQARAISRAGGAVQENVTHALAGDAAAQEVQHLTHKLSQQSTRLLENATVSLTPLSVLEAQRGLFVAWADMMTAFSRIALQTWSTAATPRKGD